MCGGVYMWVYVWMYVWMCVERETDSTGPPMMLLYPERRQVGNVDDGRLSPDASDVIATGAPRRPATDSPPHRHTWNGQDDGLKGEGKTRFLGQQHLGTHPWNNSKLVCSQ